MQRSVAPRLWRCLAADGPQLSARACARLPGGVGARAPVASAGQRAAARPAALAWRPGQQLRRASGGAGGEAAGAQGAAGGAAGQEPGAGKAAEEPPAEEPAAAEAAEAKPAPGAEAEAAPEPEAPEAPEEALKRELAELQEKAKSKKNDLLLALADFENNKKRCARERDLRRRGATKNFATKMIGVYAEFDTLAAPAPEAEGELSGPRQALHEGVVLVRDLYRATFERFGVEELRAEPGTPFVAARHEKVGATEDGSLPPNSVAELVRPGWVLEPNSPTPSVLRKAQVKLACHGPETPAAP